MANQKIAKQKVTFSYTAPAAQAVLLAGDFTGWNQAPLTLKKDKKGVWKKQLVWRRASMSTGCWLMANGAMTLAVPTGSRTNLEERTVFASSIAWTRREPRPGSND
jgi:1,4-alpha-glucan branching enzyme